MGPDFVIQHVIAAQGGAWFDIEEETEDDKKKARGLPDEGLPVPKPEIVEHLEKDVHDPDSGKLLGTIRDYCQLKEKLHEQVRFILSRARNNNEQTVNKAREMRTGVLEKWVQVQTEMAQKVKDDARISDFDDGQRFYITLIGAENLPMFDTQHGQDPYATVMMRPIHLATPKLDGRKTECTHCCNKTPFGKESCEQHKSNWIANTQAPAWNKKITVVLDAGAASVVIAIYNSRSRGQAHDLIGWCTVPSHICLYKKPVERKYPLLRADGTLLKVKAMDATSSVMMQKQVANSSTLRLSPSFCVIITSTCAGNPYSTASALCELLYAFQALVHVRWKIRVPEVAVAAGDNVFMPPGSALKGLTGKYNQRWEGGSSYYGSWQDGVPHGKGKFISEEVCAGCSRLSRVGVMIQARACFASGCCQLRYACICAQGTEYDGDWSWSKMHGQGCFKYSNGDVYTGTWKDNQRHGIGTCRAVNGDLYEGEWRFGLQHGRGRWETTDGTIYDGEWKENKAHGKGLVTEPDGQKWDGIFHQGLVIRRNDARPPTPRNITQETEFEVVSLGVDTVDQRTISSMIHLQVLK
eukprot:Tamp_01653.p1 GENE.Tamp_01653~~Tamp_01653.p1  ORF type:complete len:581 (-),score=119.93 Tamp_01653:3198-4940(-)